MFLIKIILYCLVLILDFQLLKNNQNRTLRTLQKIYVKPQMNHLLRHPFMMIQLNICEISFQMKFKSKSSIKILKIISIEETIVSKIVYKKFTMNKSKYVLPKKSNKSFWANLKENYSWPWNSKRRESSKIALWR